MYKCDDIKEIRIRYADETDRELSAEEIKEACDKANADNDSMERVLMKKETKEVRYVEINPKKYTTLKNDAGTVLKPMPPY